MRITLDKGAIMPTRAHDTDAGLDLYSRESKVVPAGGSAVFDTGVHIALPRKWYVSEIVSELSPYNENVALHQLHEFDIQTVGFLKSKSGLNVKHNITSDGVIDMGYTGSIVVKLYNHGKEDYQVNAGDKISQLVILPILTPSLELADKLEETERGNQGFGSTGV